MTRKSSGEETKYVPESTDEGQTDFYKVAGILLRGGNLWYFLSDRFCHIIQRDELILGLKITELKIFMLLEGYRNTGEHI